MAISDDYLRALGRIAVNHSALADTVGSLALDLIGAGWIVGNIIVAPMSDSQVLQLTKTLFRFRASEATGLEQASRDFDQLVARISNASAQRNAMLHGFWLADDAAGATRPVRMNLRVSNNALRFSTKYPSSAEVHAVSDELDAAMNALLEFCGRPEVEQLRKSINPAMVDLSESEEPA
jgi:hypothetical protein